MKKPSLQSIFTLCMLAVLLTACCMPAASAETTGDIVNIVILAGEETGATYFPLLPLVLSFNFTDKSVKVISFYYETQITAVAKNGETVSIPMAMLPNCENDEIAKGFETTFGIPIDRYLIYVYGYESYQPILGVFDLLFPITLDVPEEILGTAQYSTINGNMKAIANANGREYTPVTEAGAQELDAVGYIAYHTAIPESVWESSDRFTIVMADYTFSDMKHEAAVNALGEVIGRLGPDTIAAALRMLVQDQMTNITEDDIALWSASGLNIDAGDPYLTVPGFENVEMQTADTSSLTVNTFQNQMLTYDNEAIRQQIQEFLYGE